MFENHQASDKNWMNELHISVLPRTIMLPECEPPSDFRQLRQLLQVYLTQVDPLVRILHRPSLFAFMLEGKCYLTYDQWHPAPTALASAICYAASCTLDPETCRFNFGVDKTSLVLKYQRDTYYALEQADYQLTDDLTVLQAFVISLVSRRLLLSSYSIN